MYAYDPDEHSLVCGVQTFDPQQYNRRVSVPSQGKVRMEIVIQSDADPQVFPSELEDFGVFCAVQPNLESVDGVEPLITYCSCRSRREPLIQR